MNMGVDAKADGSGKKCCFYTCIACLSILNISIIKSAGDPFNKSIKYHKIWPIILSNFVTRRGQSAPKPNLSFRSVPQEIYLIKDSLSARSILKSFGSDFWVVQVPAEIVSSSLVFISGSLHGGVCGRMGPRGRHR